jgi:hypothetical protein
MASSLGDGPDSASTASIWALNAAWASRSGAQRSEVSGVVVVVVGGTVVVVVVEVVVEVEVVVDVGGADVVVVDPVGGVAHLVRAAS